MTDMKRQTRRTNRVFKSLHKPLTYLGVERTLFYFVCVGAVGTFNLFNSILAGFAVFIGGYAFGHWATNSDPAFLRILAQGDTRSTGLKWICTNGGVIYRAIKRYKWPGDAAVVVSIIHIAKGPKEGPYILDNRRVGRITAYLFHAGGNEDPEKLDENLDKSFVGSYVLGMGFTFDDTDKDGIASTLKEMEALISKDSRNAERILPYLGGEQINSSPTQAPYRYVINFEDFPLKRESTGPLWESLSDQRQRQQLTIGVVARGYPHPVAEDWPDLIAIVRERVKPLRDTQNRDALRQRWWQYADKRPGLTKAKKSLQRVMVTSQTSTYRMFCFAPAHFIFDHKTIVFPTDGFSEFACMSSRPHEIWATFMGSSMKDDPVYAPSDCFETFPFPQNTVSLETLKNAGERYYRFRAELLVRRDEGLTETYNRFHRPDEQSPDIVELRSLQAETDRAVLDAYGWTDIEPVCDFFPEFDEEDEDENSRPGRARQARYRYRWPEEIHDDVLARLLALNADRAALQPDSAVGRASVQRRPPVKRGRVDMTSEREPALFE